MSEVVTQGKRALWGKIAKESQKKVVFLVVATRTRAVAVRWWGKIHWLRRWWLLAWKWMVASGNFGGAKNKNKGVRAVACNSAPSSYPV